MDSSAGGRDMSYPYEIDALFNSERAATASSFVFLASSNPTPGPTPPTPTPTEPVKLVTGTFNVTKDGGTTVEQAHTVVEITPENWLLFNDNYGGFDSSTLDLYKGDPWYARFSMQNSESSIYFSIYLTEEENPSYGEPSTLCSITAPIMANTGDIAEENTGITVTIKTYIGEEEITNPSYEPKIDSYSEEVSTTLEDDFPIESNWLWQTGIFTTGDSEDRVYYKVCVRSVESSESSNVSNISSWSVIGQFGEDSTGTLIISSGDYSGSVETKFGFASYHRITLNKSGSEVGELQIKLFNEDGSEYPYLTQSPMGDLNLTATKI